MTSFLNDLHHAVRALRKNPGFTVTVVATLALGLGANTAIFTVINTVILHPLPYPNSDRIVNIGRSVGDTVSEPVFTFWQQNNPGFEDLAAYHAGARMTLSGADLPELVDAVTASRNYFRLFGANPILGRTFSAAEDSPHGPRVLVVSYALWQRHFAGDPAILGRTIRLGGVSHTIIGVVTPGFRPEPPADAWIPLQPDPGSTNQASILTVSARLPPGITLAQANTWIAALGKRFLETGPRSFYNPPNMRAAYLQARLTGEAQPALMILLGAVALVLLIACANVANLLLARGTARQREIAIRAAIGAARGRILRQLFTEGLLLAFSGGALGLLVGSWGVRELVALLPGDLPRLQEITAIPALDPLVALFSFGLAALTGILFALAPALQLSRTELSAALASGARTGASRRQSRTRAVLVSAEVALAVVLLCGAVLLLRSFAVLHAVNLGFDTGHLLTMEISLAGPGYGKSSEIDRLTRQLVGRAERIPGVESAAVTSALPLSGRMDMIFNIPGRPVPPGRKFIGDVQWRLVSPHYFDVLRIPLLSGRLFRQGEARPAVIISKAMAQRFWPGANPISQSIFIGPELGPTYQVGLGEIVGVVGDVRERLDLDPTPVMYQMPSQIPDADVALVDSYDPTAVLVRTRPGVAPMSVSQTVQQVLQADQLASGKIRTIEQLSIDSTARRNFNLLLLGLFAAIALLLAAVGIYGVMSYSVEQRTHEIGIRSALGAGAGETVRLVLRQALRVALAGVAAGIAASFWLTRLLTAQLFGVKPSDPLTFSTVPLVLIGIALASAYIPARRASRIDPLVALRHE